MARKKKKSGRTNQISTPRASSAIANEDDDSDCHAAADVTTASQNDDVVEESLNLLLRSPRNNNSLSSSSSGSDRDNKRYLHLSECDAYRMDVSDGDSVLVLMLHDRVGKGNVASREMEEVDMEGATAAAVCQVRIPTAGSSVGGGTPVKQRMGGKGGGRQQQRIREGECMILPQSLATRLARPLSIPLTAAASIDTPSPSRFPPMTNDVAQPTSTPTTMATPSPSKSTFSFSKGGGGDALISPPKSHSSSLPSPSNNNKPISSGGSGSSIVTIVPLHSDLGQMLQSLLCANAMELRLVPNSSPPSLTDDTMLRCGKVLERLVLASSHGLYVQRNDVLTFSFRGLRAGVCVEDVSGEAGRCEQQEEEDERLGEIFARLALDEEKEEDPSVDRNEESRPDHHRPPGAVSTDLLVKFAEAASAAQKQKPILFKIGYDTRIVFASASSSFANHESTPSSQQPVPTSSAVQSSNETQPPSPKEEELSFVAGLNPILTQIESNLLPSLLHPHLFNSTLKPPRGVLVHGPSGVGKTSVAKQIALSLRQKYHRSLEIQFVNCVDIQTSSSVVGEAERKLTRIFRKAEKKAERGGVSTLLILDDVHLICPRRGMGRGTTDRVAATLLALLDGIGSSSSSSSNTTTDGGSGGDSSFGVADGSVNWKRGNQSSRTSEPPFAAGNVVILATTTNPSTLDPALRRPGRLDAEVEIPIPDDVSRADILCFHVKRMGLIVENINLNDDSQCWLELAKLAKGFNGADCLLCIKEAVRDALLQYKSRHRGVSSSADDIAPQGETVTVSLDDLRHAIRRTKPSTISSITVEVPKVPWSSIGGMDHVKCLLRESIELPLTHGHLFESLCIPPPRGVLLYGPPGCSKTLLARAIATEGQMNFLAVKGPELLSKWLGESERALASLFRRARMASPCVVFFDEIDAIGSRRGGGGEGGGSAGESRLLSQLLTELDGVNSGPPPPSLDGGGDGKTTGGGVKKRGRVVVVGATNRPDLLDPALTRPGRIDRMIYVGLPDKKSREAILKIGLKGRAFGDDIDISALAQDDMTGGFSGAELVAICREAALLAIEEDDKESSLVGNETKNSSPPLLPMIGMKHLLHSIKGMKRQITPEMLQFYASFRNKNASQ